MPPSLAQEPMEPVDTPEDIFAMVSSGRLEDLKRLVRRNQVDVGRVRDALNRGALHIAVMKNQMPIIRYLISSVDGVDVNASDKHNQSVFHYAAHTGDTDVLQLLHSKGASLGYRDAFGRNALHHAAMHGSVSAVRWLMDNALSRHDVMRTWINETDELGSNALHWAAVKGKLDMAMFLVARGIDVHRSVGAKKRPYNLAKDAGRESCYAFLRGYITAGERLRDYCRVLQHREGEAEEGHVGGKVKVPAADCHELPQHCRSSRTLMVTSLTNLAILGQGCRKTGEEELAGHVKAFEVWKESAQANGCFYQFYHVPRLTALHEAAKAAITLLYRCLSKSISLVSWRWISTDERHFTMRRFMGTQRLQCGWRTCPNALAKRKPTISSPKGIFQMVSTLTRARMTRMRTRRSKFEYLIGNSRPLQSLLLLKWLPMALSIVYRGHVQRS